MQGEQPRPSGPTSGVCNLDFFNFFIDISTKEIEGGRWNMDGEKGDPLIEYKN